jgi:hypothetical protein
MQESDHLFGHSTAEATCKAEVSGNNSHYPATVGRIQDSPTDVGKNSTPGYCRSNSGLSNRCWKELPIPGHRRSNSGLSNRCRKEVPIPGFRRSNSRLSPNTRRRLSGVGIWGLIKRPRTPTPTYLTRAPSPTRLPSSIHNGAARHWRVDLSPAWCDLRGRGARRDDREGRRRAGRAGGRQQRRWGARWASPMLRTATHDPHTRRQTGAGYPGGGGVCVGVAYN